MPAKSRAGETGKETKLDSRHSNYSDLDSRTPCLVVLVEKFLSC